MLLKSGLLYGINLTNVAYSSNQVENKLYMCIFEKRKEKVEGGNCLAGFIWILRYNGMSIPFFI